MEWSGVGRVDAIVAVVNDNDDDAVQEGQRRANKRRRRKKRTMDEVGPQIMIVMVVQQ